MMRAFAHSWPRLAALLLVAILVAGGAITLRAQTPAEDQGVLAGFLSRLLSTPTSRVTIGGVEGALSSDAVIRDVAIADDQGTFLTIDRIRLVWRRAALLQRRIEVQRLEIGRITLARRPVARTGEPEPGPLLPELPLALAVDAFTLGELVLGEPVLGGEVRLSARGSASLGAPSQGLSAALEVRRRDAPGTADLSLSFVPVGQRLTIRLSADEPAGGVLARLAQIPGTPPVRLELAGAGVLDDFTANLAFEGGPETDARGTARLARVGGERALTLDLAARVAPLLPGVVQPIFAGVTRLSGDLGFLDAGGLQLRNLRLAAPLAELVVNGSLAADRRLDVTVAARAVPNRGGSTEAGRGRLDRLVFDASARGPLDSPRIEGLLDLAGLVTPEGSLAALSGRFDVTPLGGASQRFRFSANAEARGLAPADPGLDAALGRDIRLALRGEADEAGVARFDEARIISPTLSLAFEGRLAQTLIDGRASIAIARLAAFSRLTGLELDGRASLDATLAGNPSTRVLSAALTGRSQALKLGDARLERLLGEAPRFDGRIASADDGLSVSGLTLIGAAAQARLEGRLGAQDVALDATADLFDLRVLDARLAGRASAAARLTGARADPSLTLALSAAEATALGRPVRDLALSLTANSIASAPRAVLSGGGRIGGKPLRLDARVDANGPPGASGWRVEQLAATLGSVSLNAVGRLTADGYLEGDARLAAADLDDVSALALTPLAGRIEATITARASAPRQDFTLKATSTGLAAAGLRAATVRSDITALDLYARPVLRGEIRANGVVSGALVLDTVSLLATDGGDGQSAIVLDGRGGGFTLAGAARVRPGEPTAILFERFRAARAGRVLTLAAPATVLLSDGGVRTAGLTLDLAGGRIAVAGSAGRALDLTATLRSVPLAAADAVAPGLGAAGVADGEIRLGGPAAAPTGSFDLNLRNASLAATREAGLPPLAVTGRGTLSAGTTNLTVRIAGGRTIDLSVTGSVGLSADPRLDLRLAGTIDAGLANRRLGPGQRVAGRVAVDATIGGTRGQPRLGGGATITGGSFSDALGGVAIEGIEGRINGTGDTILIERLVGRPRGGGSLALAGRIATDPGRSFPADLRLTAREARLLDSGLARLVADADVTVTGPLATSPRIAGRIAVASLDVRVPERLGGASEPLRDARHVAPPPQTRARLAQAARTARPAGRRAAPPFRATLDLSVDAPGRIFVRGRGIDAELGGSLRLGGTTLAPTATGAFDLRRGRLTILTQRLDFSRGRLTFGGAGFIPELDFAAETRAGDVTARVTVTGPADQPAFAFSSSPALPEDEVLSRLLFQRAAGGLSPLQALQLAQAAAQLSGGGPDAFEEVRRALGVDDLDVNFANGGATVGVSRAIGNRARLNLRAGTRPENTGVGVDIDLTRRLRLQSEIGPDGRASVGVGIEQEY